MEVTTEKRRLVITLGENEAPAAYHWEAVRFVRENGEDVIPPAAVRIEATAEEAGAHLNAALLASRDGLASSAGQKATRIQELESDNEAKVQQLEILTQERDLARNALAALQSTPEPA